MAASTTTESRIALLQRFVAFGRVAHARIDAAGEPYRNYRAAGGAIFPLTVRMKHGSAFVAEVGGTDGVLPGDELLEIDGLSATPLIASLWRDLSADTPYMFAGMVEWELSRLLWQRLGSRATFQVTVRTGRSRSRTIVAAARDRTLLQAAAAAGPPRLTLEKADRSHRMLAPGLGYFRSGPFYAPETPDRPYDNTAFKTLVDFAFDDLMRAGAKTLIIDLRDNPCGDSSFSDHMVAWFAHRPFRFASRFSIRVSPETVASNAARLAVPGNDPTGISAQFAELYSRARPGDVIDFPVQWVQPREGRRFTGRVFVLIDRLSYSNTVTVAALVQDFRLGKVLGEETSDLATTLGAMETFALSGSGVRVGFPKARIVRPSGSLAMRGVVPDVAIDTPVVEDADDPVLKRAIALAIA